MASTGKQKLAAVAKDFNLKNKDIADIFAEINIPGKNSSSSVDDNELNLLMERVSLKAVVPNIDDYLYFKGTRQAAVKTAPAKSETVPSKPDTEPAAVKEEKAPPPRVLPPEPKKPETHVNVQTYAGGVSVSAVTVEPKKNNKNTHKSEPKLLSYSATPDDKPNTKHAVPAATVQQKPAPAAPEVKHEVKPVAKPEIKSETKPDIIPEVKPEVKPVVIPEVKPAPKLAPKPAPAAQPAPQRKKTEAEKAAQAQQIAARAEAARLSDKVLYPFRTQAEQNRNGPARKLPPMPKQPLSNMNTNQKPQNNQNQSGNQPKQQSTQTQTQVQPPRQAHPVERQASQRRDFSAAPVFREKEKQNTRKPVSGQPSVQVGANAVAITAAQGRANEGGVKYESAKHVDTRTSTVDLSRYDEGLEKFVQDTGRENTKAPVQTKQKLPQSRPPQKDRYGKYNDRDRLALEKLQKTRQLAEIEKAKKKSLVITLPEQIIVSDLAAKLRVTTAEVVKKLFMLGKKASANEVVDYEEAALAAMEFGAKVEKEVIVTIEDKLFDESADTEDKLIARAPVVVVMGHVDHGKTSILDAIRHTQVMAGEAGGITQHIGAYRVDLNGREITFLDTPGHAAFTAMRARGAMATDIAILVVAADDGIMPQTIEAINHAKAAGVSIIVAMNKMDKPGADPDRIKGDLTKYELVPEDWGGDVICVPVSAITGQGLDLLLENVLLVADMKELKANPSRLAQGVVIEAKLDKGRGPVATVLVQNGTLKPGDVVIAGTTVGHVRAMTSDRGETVLSAGPSVPVEIIGLSETPNAGDSFRAVEDERMARELVDRRKADEKEELFKEGDNLTLEDLFSQIKAGIKELGIIIKADVQGSVEAVKTALIKESTEEVKIKVIHSAVGGILESDVMLASASGAIIIGFNVRPDKAALDAAERKQVDIRTYRIIYECIEEMNKAMKGLLAPKFREVIAGHAQVRQTIKVPNVGTIAGSYVQDGKITRNTLIRVIREGTIIFEDKILSLRRFKDDVREVAAGYECGIGLEKFNDIRELDILEAFISEQIVE
ncbi:hypothetical protein FACS1894219_01680 [Clostridia bacterium]|nr:hypothetical protein FACS1894219_01680 [Clostridia bacterium]